MSKLLPNTGADPRHEPVWVDVTETTRRCSVCGETQRLIAGKWRWVTEDIA